MSYSPMADDLLDLMPHHITLEAFGGKDDHGDPLPYGPVRTYHAYVSEDAAALYTATGEVVMASTSVLFHPQATDGTVLTHAGDNDRLTLSDGSQPRILRVGPLTDEIGIVSWQIRS